jgi:hypothetical protein
MQSLRSTDDMLVLEAACITDPSARCVARTSKSKTVIAIARRGREQATMVGMSPRELLALVAVSGGLLCLVACSDSDSDPDDMDDMDGAMADAAIEPEPDAHDWGDVAVTGRACTVLDFRDPYICPAGQDVRDLVIEDMSSGSSVTTLDDGSFGLDVTGDEVVLRLSSSSDDRRTSLVRVRLQEGRARDVIVPVVAASVWTDFLGYLGTDDDPDSGTVLVKIFDGGEPGIGMVVVPPEGTVGPIHYDAGGPFDWSESGPSGERAMALVHGVPAAEGAQFLIRDLLGGRVAEVGGIPSEAGALTFERVDIQEDR